MYSINRRETEKLLEELSKMSLKADSDNEETKPIKSRLTFKE
jgi:hypothetical protein